MGWRAYGFICLVGGGLSNILKFNWKITQQTSHVVIGLLINMLFSMYRSMDIVSCEPHSLRKAQVIPVISLLPALLTRILLEKLVALTHGGKAGFCISTVFGIPYISAFEYEAPICRVPLSPSMTLCPLRSLVSSSLMNSFSLGKRLSRVKQWLCPAGSVHNPSLWSRDIAEDVDPAL
jgi:hypothetical protein